MPRTYGNTFNTGTFSGALSATGNFAVNTNKFTVAATTGNTVVAGTLSATGNFAVNTNKFAVAAATGIITLENGATIDNDASASILIFTETTIRAAGILDVTGNSTLVSADIGGGFTSGTGSGCTIAATGALSTNGAIITEGAITTGNNGATGHAGTFTVNNGANPGAASFSIAGSTGIVTMDGGATLDNNGSASVLVITETTIRAAGILDVTGNSTLVSVDVGGGYGSTGATISATGVITANGAITTDGNLVALSADIGGGYGDTGCTISAAGNISANGDLAIGGTAAITGALTLTSSISVGAHIHLTPGGAPATTEGNLYYDSATHKLVVRVAAGWETVTSA